MNKNEGNQISQRNKNNKIDILNIITILSDNYSTYNSIYQKNLINLISFYENLSLVLETIPSKIIFPKIENKTLFNDDPSINIINKFYNYHKSLLINLNKMSSNIKKNIIPRLNNYKFNLENENNNISIFMEELTKKITIHQQKINDAYKNYTSEYEKFKQLELDSVKKLSNTSMLGVIHKNLDEQRKKATNYSVIRQQEIQILNKLYNESQEEMIKKIFQIKQKYKINNDTILGSIKEYLNIWNNNFFDFTINESKTLYENIEFIKENENLDNFIDLILINENNKIVFYNKWKYTQNNNNNFPNLNNEDEEENENSSNIFKIPKIPFTDIKYDPENMLILKDKSQDNHKQQNRIIKTSRNEPKSEDPEFINYFFLSLRKNKDILSSQLSDIVNLLEKKQGKINFYQDFCDIYLFNNNQQINFIFEFINFTNMAHLKTFLNNILENISMFLINKNKDSFALLDKILIIGEKTLYDNIYLCSLLNKNKIFNNKSIWEDSIKFKVIDLLNQICDQNTTNSYINEGFNFIKNKSTKYINGFFGFETKKQSKRDNIVEYLGLVKKLPNYNKLSDEKKIIFNKNQAPIIIHDVFKTYIRHMNNYDYNLGDSINVIYDIYSYYQFNDNDIINYFLNYNNICYYSCKNKNQKLNLIHKKEKIKEKIKDIKTKRINSIKYPTRFREQKSKIIILKNIYIFLDNKEKIKLFLLSKSVKSEISKKIYKYILKQKTTPVAAHIQIWKIFLDFTKLQKDNKNIYNNLKKEIETPETKQEYQKVFKIIDVDVSRTEFSRNKIKGQNAVKNILKCLQLYNFENKYCQGMNYIAAFLYENTLNEEESYYIILSLFMNKKYSSIFKDGMVQLKNYFLIMDRLIYLFLPKIYYHFKRYQIMPDFFMSPYFITLFTHIYTTIQEKNNIFILRIWDEFIINGWKSIFEVILTLLKIKEKNLMLCQADELVDFLVNKINKDEIFLNKNLEKFEEIKKNFIIPNELMKYLEEEIILENKLKK